MSREKHLFETPFFSWSSVKLCPSIILKQTDNKQILISAESGLGEFDTHREYWGQQAQRKATDDLFYELVWMDGGMQCGIFGKGTNAKGYRWLWRAMIIYILKGHNAYKKVKRIQDLCKGTQISFPPVEWWVPF